jgi:hypothetical protein
MVCQMMRQTRPCVKRGGRIWQSLSNVKADFFGNAEKTLAGSDAQKELLFQ